MNPKIDDDLFELLLPEHQFDIALQTVISGLSEKFVLLVVEKNPETAQAGLQLLKTLAKNFSGVFVSINRPAIEASDFLELKKIDSIKIAFVDCISTVSGLKQSGSKNFFYSDSPKNLMELSLSIDYAIGFVLGKNVSGSAVVENIELPSLKPVQAGNFGKPEQPAMDSGKNFFIIVDSLSTLLVYNDEKLVEKFAHRLSGKARLLNAKAVFLINPGKKLIQTISSFCDKTIYV